MEFLDVKLREGSFPALNTTDLLESELLSLLDSLLESLLELLLELESRLQRGISVKKDIVNILRGGKAHLFLLLRPSLLCFFLLLLLSGLLSLLSPLSSRLFFSLDPFSFSFPFAAPPPAMFCKTYRYECSVFKKKLDAEENKWMKKYSEVRKKIEKKDKRIQVASATNEINTAFSQTQN